MLDQIFFSYLINEDVVSILVSVLLSLLTVLGVRFCVDTFCV